MANKLQITDVYIDGTTLDGTKLNTLVSGINNAFAMFSGVLADFGGDDRVIDENGSTSELEISESAAPDMNVNCSPGYAIVSGMVIQNESAAVLTLVAPVVSNRWDICQISNEGVLSTKSSTEEAVPAEPSADADNIKLAAIYLPQNAPHINDEGGAAGGDGEIFDRRTPMSLHPVTVKRHKSFSMPGDVSTTGGDANDGYYHSIDGGAGFKFGQAITIEEAFISTVDKPTGADLIITLHNMTAVTSDTITLSAGALCEIDTSVSLNFAAGDVLGIQVTQIGSGVPGSFVEVDLQYVLQ